MKNKLIILLSLFTTWQANAQKTDYIKLLDTTNRWYCSELQEFGDVEVLPLKLGDIHIYDDTAYYRIVDVETETGQGRLREDTITKKVYEPYQILYDFSLKEGDSILLRNPYGHLLWYYVDSVRTIQTLIDERKVWYLNDNEYLNQYPIWVEGIGSLAGILKPSYSPTLCCWGWGELNCFYNNETLVFQSALAQQYGCLFENINVNNLLQKEIKIYPNPTTNRLTIDVGNINTSNLQLNIYNSVGKKVLQQKIINTSFDVFTNKLPKGIYVINIKNNNKSIINTKFIKH